MLIRKKIAEGVHFNTVTDARFKFNRITIGFHMPLDEEKASLNALIPRVLSDNNANFPHTPDFYNHLASLYNAKVDFEVRGLGDTQFWGQHIYFMDDGYSLSGEKITAIASKTLFDCLFRPSLIDGVFPVVNTELCKRMQIEAIEAEINEKRLYAYNQANRIIHSGEPAAVNPLGTVERTREITPERLYEAYERLLENAVIEIVCVGCNDFSDALSIAEGEFSALRRQNITPCESVFSPLKTEVAEKTELLPLNQSKMVLGFKADACVKKDRAAFNLMSDIYGETIFSKLFLNVREKLSLCYYCWSQTNKLKSTMVVTSGVEEENIDKAKAEILAQFECMKKGDFTDEDLNHALLHEQNNVKTVNDSLGSLTWWYFTLIYQDMICTPEEYLKIYEDVRREDIMRLANSMKLDTFYTLRAKEDA
ncbi:MAG: insulinase family protein [Oscillospiraceae bacterium]|nr:insulinase family protein [Oscillospiraceae bacterium]